MRSEVKWLYRYIVKRLHGYKFINYRAFGVIGHS